MGKRTAPRLAYRGRVAAMGKAGEVGAARGRLAGMRFALPVTPSSLLRLEELRAAARPTGSKPPVFNIPEADAAAEAIRALARGEQPSATPPVGRWLVAAIGPVVATWDPLRPDGPGLVHSCEVDVVAYVAPVPLRYVTAADLAGVVPPPMPRT